jgi:hypothetical protein
MLRSYLVLVPLFFVTAPVYCRGPGLLLWYLLVVTPVYLLQRVNFVMSPDHCFGPCLFCGPRFFVVATSYLGPLFIVVAFFSVVAPGYL